MRAEPGFGRGDVGKVEPVDARPRALRLDQPCGLGKPRRVDVDERDLRRVALRQHHRRRAADAARRTRDDRALALDIHDLRSEEHTSELQSLMRISYAVFCLKKKITNYKHNLKHLNHKQETA